MKRLLISLFLAMSISSAFAASDPCERGQSPCQYGWILFVWEANTGAMLPPTGERFGNESTCELIESVYKNDAPNSMVSIKAACKLYYGELKANQFVSPTQ